MGDAAKARRLESQPARRSPPRYSSGRGTEMWAAFPAGLAVPVVRGRVRSYPGLPGPAPSTRAFYRAVAGAAPGVRRVIDAGCGSGVGSELLSASFEEVVAIDSDPRALAFTEQYAGVEIVRSTFEESLELAKAGAAIVADVLGHVKEPARFLGSLRSALTPRAPVIVAEPAAFVAQRLGAPARRAFSPAHLEALLVRGGFHVREWLPAGSGFVACVAVASDDEAWRHFFGARGGPGDVPESALSALEAAGRSGRRDVQREALLAQAEIHMAVSSGDAAARAFLRAAELDGGDPRPLAGLSLLALAGGSASDAFDLAARAAKLDPTEAAAATALASAADGLGHGEAWNAWRVAQRLAPDDLRIASRVAAQAADRGDYALGVSVFERLRSYGDALPVDYYVTLALLLTAEGRRADALLELRMARAMAPHDATVNELWAELQAADS